MELVRQSYGAFERRDLDGLLDRFHPRSTRSPRDRRRRSPPRPGSHQAGLEQTFEAFEDFHVQVEEHHEAGDELVVFVRYSGRGRASGARVDAELAHVWTFGEGTPIRLRQFLDRAAALEAAGL